MNYDIDLTRIAEIVATSETGVSESHLALTGDKLFLFAATGETCLMYGQRKRTRIALGAPIGKEADAEQLIDRFLKETAADKCMGAFYAVRHRHLHLFQNSGLISQKIGEMALVPIKGFNLQGKEKARYRQARNRAVREGVSFEIVNVQASSDLMNRLEYISNIWLAGQAGREKGFSLGRFHRDVLARYPIAIARKEGEIIAFSNLWSSPDKKELSLDLMRYIDGHMVGVIDFLLVESMIWGSEQGYHSFSLGMAPLAGLDSEDHRNVISRLCRLAYNHGDKIYGFKGIRQFKKKFNPEWEPVYLLASRQIHMPRALRNLTLLSSGSFKGLVSRD